MAEYRVLWEIDAEAESPREAAEWAWNIMRKPGSTANVFTVVDTKRGESSNIDLSESEERAL